MKSKNASVGSISAVLLERGVVKRTKKDVCLLRFAFCIPLHRLIEETLYAHFFQKVSFFCQRGGRRRYFYEKEVACFPKCKIAYRCRHAHGYECGNWDLLQKLYEFRKWLVSRDL